MKTNLRSPGFCFVGVGFFICSSKLSILEYYFTIEDSKRDKNRGIREILKIRILNIKLFDSGSVLSF